MRFYEFSFIVQNGLVHNEVDGLVQELKTWISKCGGEVRKYEYWGLLDFAYPIKKFTKGHYCMFYIEIETDGMKEFKRKIKVHEDVLRCLCLRIDCIPEQDSEMLKARLGASSGRDESINVVS